MYRGTRSAGSGGFQSANVTTEEAAPSRSLDPDLQALLDAPRVDIPMPLFDQMCEQLKRLEVLEYRDRNAVGSEAAARRADNAALEVVRFVMERCGSRTSSRYSKRRSPKKLRKA
jgi:hypothetical protein